MVLLFFNPNSNAAPDGLREIKRKTVDSQAQTFSTKDKSQAVLFCLGSQVAVPVS
jgi:hypothetical protein